MSKTVSLLFHCVNPLCPHRFHVGEFPAEASIPDKLIVGRLGARALARLDKFKDSDSYQKALATIGKKHQRATSKDAVTAGAIPYIDREKIAEYLQDESKPHSEEADNASIENLNTISGVVTMTTEQVRNRELDVVEFVADPSLPPLDAVRARVAHYQSETLRLEALRISLDLKNK
ncbi:hypothetical protein Presley_64 [Acinetobacter phage Presley]|uniref:Uncharacterized protein n=1 Tax=Acinetobacter phage Presley TaxID=1406780 RepID=U5PWK5_9CAUD|nr:hypothetical protein Presley_64 [Acinetobacter phage Presley]AGY48131.1 hypothetical protein Presley_64 [Acinetobacter phage Presley]